MYDSGHTVKISWIFLALNHSCCHGGYLAEDFQLRQGVLSNLNEAANDTNDAETLPKPVPRHGWLIWVHTVPT